MSLLGECEDCEETAQLRHKPDVAMSEQSRPSVCWRCRDRREARLEEQEYRRDRHEPLPPRYDSARESREYVDPSEADR